MKNRNKKYKLSFIVNVLIIGLILVSCEKYLDKAPAAKSNAKDAKEPAQKDAKAPAKKDAKAPAKKDAKKDVKAPATK